MEKVRTVSGTGDVTVSGEAIGHCAYEINVYKDEAGRVKGHGHVMGEEGILGKMSSGQRIQIAGSDHKPFAIMTGEWSPGARMMEVETGPDILN